MSAYLLTWNPGHAKAGGNESPTTGSEQSWNCSSQQPGPGDTVYVVRTGADPRGIVARGVVTRGPEPGEHWRDPAQTASYIRVRIEEYRPDCASGLVPMALLQAAMPQQHWSPLASGIAIAEAVLVQLQALWTAGAGVHSLRQFADWNRKREDAQYRDWLAEYRKVTAAASAAREHPQALDDAAMHLLWAHPNNGISHVSAGTLSGAEFEGAKPLLDALTRRILARPDAQTMQEVETEWADAVAKGRFRQRSPAVIRRVFAAADPGTITTLVRDQFTRALLKILREDFQLPTEPVQGWVEQNRRITDAMKTAGLDPGHVLENNMAVWELFARSSRPEAAGPATDDSPAPGVPPPLAAQTQEPVPTNTILYGPPGTGKTFATISCAIAILAPEFSGAPREQQKRKFDELAAAGQIVFTTFHQSFAYEDFVEGIRARTTATGGMEYVVEPGVFKRLCEQAARGQVAAEDPFDQAVSRLLKRMTDAENGRVKMATSQGKPFDAEYEGGDTFLVFPASTGAQAQGYTASMKLVRQLYSGVGRQAVYNSSYVKGMLAYLHEECGLPVATTAPTGPQERKQFVLIIDEINRGNVSRIFGELITLIEPSKRAGMPEALSVVLPYSPSEPFSVPQNLHIIGTMNTADRSLAGLDLALRRRFEFVEVPPAPDVLKSVVVGGVLVADLLRVMNARIELLLDRDHRLGHAYFVPLIDAPPEHALRMLARIFRNSVLPLLQEYFFEDWQRIQWVLNDHRKPEVLRFLQQPPSDAATLLGADVPVNEQNRRWSINEEAFLAPDAYAGIIDAKLPAAT